MTDRRTFVSEAFVAAAAALLAGCSVSSIDGSTSVNGSIKVTDYPSLANTGGIALVTVSGTPLAIVRTGTSTFLALSRICPHQGATINQTGNGFTCPRHGAQFSSTGTWVGGQVTSDLQSFNTQYDSATGTLTIG